MRLAPFLAALASVALIAGACGGSSSSSSEGASSDPPGGEEPAGNVLPTPTPTPGQAPTPDQSAPAVYADPLVTPSGNRVAAGSGFPAGAAPIDVELPGQPDWVVGLPSANGDVWAVALSDGSVLGYRVAAGLAAPFPLGASRLPAGQPPVLVERDGSVELAPSPPNASPLTSPRFVGNRIVYVDNDGNLSILDPDGTVRVPEVDVLPDTRIVEAGDGQLLLLAGPTGQYAHGVLGDELEATQVVSIDPDSGAVELVYEVEPTRVIEGIGPLIADVDGDGTEEILLTVSDDEDGARLRVVAFDGSVIAESEGLGIGERWRHQIAVAGTGPSGAVEIVDVRTPHIGGVLEFLTVEGGALELAAELDGYQSHTIGSRNLDQAIVADADGDSTLEVILPTQDRTAIQGIERVDGSAVVVWGQQLDGFLSTNVGVLTRADGTISLATGTEEGTLRIWP